MFVSIVRDTTKTTLTLHMFWLYYYVHVSLSHCAKRTLDSLSVCIQFIKRNTAKRNGFRLVWVLFHMRPQRLNVRFTPYLSVALIKYVCFMCILSLVRYECDMSWVASMCKRTKSHTNKQYDLKSNDHRLRKYCVSCKCITAKWTSLNE